MFKEGKWVSASGSAWRWVALAALAWHASAHAGVNMVDQVDTGFFVSSDPTATFHWPAADAKAAVIFVPGGNGSIGLKPHWPDMPSHHFIQMLRRLSDPALGAGKLDVVFLDSPKPLDLGAKGPYQPLRSSSDHMVRMLSVVEYYRKKLDKPVWLFGHSNGTISISEFQRYLAGKDKADLVSGYIYSGSVNGYGLPSNVSVPVLFVHHESDGCVSTPPAPARRAYESVRDAGRVRTAFVSISTGSVQAGDPCRSGHHMYFGAGDEVAGAIERFVLGEGVAK